MSYTPPPHNNVQFDVSTADDDYTPPAGDAVHFENNEYTTLAVHADSAGESNHAGRSTPVQILWGAREYNVAGRISAGVRIPVDGIGESNAAGRAIATTESGAPVWGSRERNRVGYAHPGINAVRARGAAEVDNAGVVRAFPIITGVGEANHAGEVASSVEGVIVAGVGEANGAGTMSDQLPEITATADLIVPTPVISGFAYQSAPVGANLIFPAPSLSAFGGARAALTMPLPVLSASASADIWARASLTVPNPVLSASASMETMARASLTVGLPVIEALGGARAGLSVPLPTINGSAVLDTVARADLVVPLPIIAASAIQDATARADLTFPLPVPLYGGAQLSFPSPTIQASATLEELAELIAYALNVRTGAMTPYDNYPFRFIVRFQGQNLGIGPDGVFLLEGDRDVGENINAHITLPPTDFGVSQEKRGPYVYIGSDDRQQLLVTAEIDEKKTVTAATAMAGRNKRAKMPRGAKGRFWAHTVRNVNGGRLDIDSIEILPEIGRRKV